MSTRLGQPSSGDHAADNVATGHTGGRAVAGQEATRVVRHVPVLPLAVLYLLALGFMVVVIALGAWSGQFGPVLQDTYHTTGSRLVGIASLAGFVLWGASVTVCLFSAAVLRALIDDTDRGVPRLLVATAFIGGLLLLDDALAIHELAGETVVERLLQGGHTLQNLVELGVLGLGVGLILVYAAASRERLRRLGAWPLLWIALAWFGLSTVLDVAPPQWAGLIVPSRPQGFEGAQMALEETLKLLGIVTWLVFCWQLARRALDEGWPERATG